MDANPNQVDTLVVIAALREGEVLGVRAVFES